MSDTIYTQPVQVDLCKRISAFLSEPGLPTSLEPELRKTVLTDFQYQHFKRL